MMRAVSEAGADMLDVAVRVGCAAWIKAMSMLIAGIINSRSPEIGSENSFSRGLTLV